MKGMMQPCSAAPALQKAERERELIGPRRQKKAPANRLFIVSLLPVPDSGSFGLSYFFLGKMENLDSNNTVYAF
jgi:hypothetical protein